MFDLSFTEPVRPDGANRIAGQRREVDIFKVLEGLGVQTLQVVLSEQKSVQSKPALRRKELSSLKV